jgi:hypothetical protein
MKSEAQFWGSDWGRIGVGLGWICLFFEWFYDKAIKTVLGSASSAQNALA